MKIEEKMLKLKEEIAKDPSNMKLKKKYHDLDYMSVNTRSDALERGWSIYNDKKRCDNGHLSDRRTSDGKCLKCLKMKKTAPKSFVTHAPILNIKDEELFLNEIVKEINKEYPNFRFENMCCDKVKISPDYCKYFIKAPDYLIDFIDNLSIKSIKGK